uniref:WEB family protein n=1 Tax=Oryza punctata TaxID=4537 RepID=A0A0E0KM82_ORYPU
MGGNGGGDGVTVVGRAEIDMRAPFRSVKEAVVLFGEREKPLLAGDVHGPAGLRRLRSMNRAATTPPAIWPTFSQQQVSGGVAAVTHHVAATATAELEEAKQELEKERSEKQKMAGCILSLQEELSHAMSELNKLKARDNDDDDDDGGEAAAKVIDLQVEDLKFVEIDDDKPQLRQQSASPGEFQKRRYVTFADPPTASAYDRAPPQAPLPDVVIELRHRHNHNAPSPPQLREVRFMRQVSAGHGMMKAAAVVADEEGRKKKKSLIPLVGALFMRKKKMSSSSSCSCHNDDSSLTSF